MAKAKPAWTNDPYQLPWRKTLGTGRWPVRTLQERFDSKLLPGPGDCWGWSGAVDESNGYAKFSIKTANECRACVRARDRARNVNGGRREHYAAMYQKRKAAAASR